MAKQNNTNEVEEIYEQNQKITFQTMQEIVDKKKIILDLKSNIHIHEEHKKKLKEYITILDKIVLKTNKIEKNTKNLNSLIEETKKSIINTKKVMADIDSKNKVELNLPESNKKLVMNMKKVLTEMYDSKFDSLIQKEKKLQELKNKTKDFNTSSVVKEKQIIIDSYTKKYNLLKVRNMNLKEMITMNIKQQI